MAQMNNYLNNNIVLINMYENLYANGIRIDEIIQMFKKGEFAQYSGFDFGRFRVFVDGCLLLINKEKRNYSAPRLGYINFWSKQRKYNFCFIIALLRKVDNFSM